MMLLTSVFAEIETSVVCERPNVAISIGPLGTPIGVQLAAVFQSPEIGSRSHWVLIAYVTAGTIKISAGKSQLMEAAGMDESFMTLPTVILLAFVFILLSDHGSLTIADGICEQARVSVGGDKGVCWDAGNKVRTAVLHSPLLCVR